MYQDGFVPIGDAYDPGPGDPTDPPINPYRSRPPYQDPFPSDQFYNVPIGSGLTAYPHTDARYTRLQACNVINNFDNWTDPFYQATTSDPFVTLEWRTILPGSYAGVANTAMGAPEASTTSYPTLKKITGLRVPLSATWQKTVPAPSTSNSDRKVIVNQAFPVTLTITPYVNNVPGTPYTESYPAGALNVEIHKFYRTTGATTVPTTGVAGTVIYCTNLSWNNVATDYGLLDGAVASDISPSQGYIRSWEVGRMNAGDEFAVKHVLKLGGSLSMFKWDTTLAKAAIRWPAKSADGHASATNYTGPFEYGTHLHLPASFDVDAFVESRYSSIYWPYQKSVLNAMKYFGGVFLITTGSGNIIRFGFEPRAPFLTTAISQQCSAAFLAAIPSMEVSSNYHSVGTLRADRQPVEGVNVIAGGGPRRTAGLGLTDFENTSGLKLPVNPDPASWV
jgi:hypothetical protein